MAYRPALQRDPDPPEVSFADISTNKSSDSREPMARVRAALAALA
jgi:hypothetical protein